MSAHSQIRALCDLIPNRHGFQRWCEQAEIRSLAAFVEADLRGAPRSWAAVGKQVQEALVEAHALFQADGSGPAVRLLERRLRRAPGRIHATATTLQRLVPICAETTAEPGAKLSAREALDRLGGVAGARAVAELLSSHHGREVTARQVRDRFRNTGGAVRKLGAGYFATRSFQGAMVLHWVESRLANGGGETKDSLCQAILGAYPHGDERAIRAWLHQQPGVVSLRGERVRLVQERILPFDHR